jgi:hypothetical protein
MKLESVLFEEFEKLRFELIEKHNELGMRSSGKWTESLNTVVEKGDGFYRATTYGIHYTKQLVYGREPGKFPPIKSIEDWIKNKGIKFLESEIKISSLAFLIARKIAREGTEYYKKGGTDLVSSIYTPERIQEIIDKVSRIDLDFIILDLRETFKTL